MNGNNVNKENNTWRNRNFINENYKPDFFSNCNLNVYNTFIKYLRIHYNILIISTPATPLAPSNSLSISPTPSPNIFPFL